MVNDIVLSLVILSCEFCLLFAGSEFILTDRNRFTLVDFSQFFATFSTILEDSSSMINSSAQSLMKVSCFPIQISRVLGSFTPAVAKNFSCRFWKQICIAPELTNSAMVYHPPPAPSRLANNSNFGQKYISMKKKKNCIYVYIYVCYVEALWVRSQVFPT